MTTTLHKAFEKASQLNSSEQDLLAAQIVDDIKNEIKWKASLKKPTEKLSILAKKAINEFSSGKTKKLGFDEI